jgi:hypothetical protein
MPPAHAIVCRRRVWPHAATAQVTTCRGIVMGRLRSQQRQKEVELMRFCFRKLGARACVYVCGGGGGVLHAGWVQLLAAIGVWGCAARVPRAPPLPPHARDTPRAAAAPSPPLLPPQACRLRAPSASPVSWRAATSSRSGRTCASWASACAPTWRPASSSWSRTCWAHAAWASCATTSTGTRCGARACVRVRVRAYVLVEGVRVRGWWGVGART